MEFKYSSSEIWFNERPKWLKYTARFLAVPTYGATSVLSLI